MFIYAFHCVKRLKSRVLTRKNASKKCQSLCSLNLRLDLERGKIFMAMYHFRIKSDKKPNGTKISAVKHVEYINREGTFAHDEQWKQTNKFVGNFISTENRLLGRNVQFWIFRIHYLLIFTQHFSLSPRRFLFLWRPILFQRLNPPPML